MTYYITRAVLNRQAPEYALKPLLDPEDRNAALDAHRRLIWTLFPDRTANRDFLWRADGKGKFVIVSARKPQHTRLFSPIESKPYSPALSTGDRLVFILRVNATKDRRTSRQEEVRGNERRPQKDRRVDIVMHALHELVQKGEDTGGDFRTSRRMDIANDVARSWFAKQGTHRGYSVENLAVEDYRARKVKRPGSKDATIGILDLKGVLKVSEPEKLTDTLYNGIGRSKAFGCGLLLVRRA